MKQDERQASGTQRQTESRTTRPGQRAGAAPGRKTRTERIAGPAAGGGAAPVPPGDPASATLQMKWAATTARWMPTAVRPDLFAEPVQRATTRDGSTAGGELPSDGAGKAMPVAVQTKMDRAFGTDLSAVRIHEGPRSEALGARAYTQGTDVHFAPGEYRPDSQSGQELLGHELAHVVQQSQGRVRATTQAKGVGVNDDSALEAEADAMGAKAARGVSTGGDASETDRAGASAGLQFSRDKSAISQARQTPDSDSEHMIPAPRGAATLLAVQARSQAPIQAMFSEQKDTNNVAIDGAMAMHRASNGHWNFSKCQKNYAVNAEEPSEYAFSDEGGHAERNLLLEMFPGRQRGADVYIHTERETCGSCYDTLKGMHDKAEGTENEFNMFIGYTVDYPGDGDSKEKLHEYYNTNYDMPDKQE